MPSENETATTLEDVKIDVKIKVSALWAALMFLFIYVDHFYLYVPGTVEGILSGTVWKFQITQGWALSAMIMMTIPALMIFLSVTLKAKANRRTNIVLGILYFVIVVGNVVGESWAFYIFASMVELVLITLIIRYAWKWPVVPDAAA